MPWCAIKDCNSGRKNKAKLYENEGSDVGKVLLTKTVTMYYYLLSTSISSTCGK